MHSCCAKKRASPRLHQQPLPAPAAAPQASQATEYQGLSDNDLHTLQCMAEAQELARRFSAKHSCDYALCCESWNVEGGEA